MYNTGIEIPKVSFSSLDYTEIEGGSYFIGFDLDNSGKLSKIDNAGNITVIEGSGGGGGIVDLLIDITHAALVTAKNSSNLIPGVSYRITDFQTIYDQPDYSDQYTAKQSVELKTASIDPIIVRAVSDSELGLDAFQESYPLDKIKYILEYETLFSGTPTKGRIIERIDEWNNRTDFDHRTVLFKRYFSLTGTVWHQIRHSSYWDTSLNYPEREYDIITNTPALVDGVESTYLSYVCTTAGTRDFGSGNITVNVGDWLVVDPYNGMSWAQVDGWIEMPVFMTNGINPFKPNNNYIQGIYDAKQVLNDEFYDVPFDITNIVFNDFETYDNTLNGACTNVTFFGTTYENDISAYLLNVTIGDRSEYGEFCIGNKISYRLKNITISGVFTGNILSQMVQVNLDGDFRNNNGGLVYSILGRGNIEHNTFTEMSDIQGVFSQVYLGEFRIYYNKFNIISEITFNNISNLQTIIGCNILKFQYCDFQETGTLYYCNFTQFLGNDVYSTMSFCKGIDNSGNKFYGRVSSVDFGPYFRECQVGPNFGDTGIEKSFPVNYESELPTPAYSNIIQGSIYECVFGANVTGNVFEGEIRKCEFPSFFKNNHVKNLPTGAPFVTLVIEGIPELTSSTATQITTRKINLTQQILDDNNITDVIFQDVDENGDDRYWFRHISSSNFNELPFMTKSTTLAGATGTALGSGYSNSLIISKKDDYNRGGAIGQVYYTDGTNFGVPSLDELVLIYTNKASLGIPSAVDIYWSSSEINATTAYAVDFSDGSILSILKTESHSVIPISYATSFNTVILKYTDEYGSEIVKSIF
jgi:hypothetical protein